MCDILRQTAPRALSLLVFLTLPFDAQAADKADEVVPITQAKALSGGVTPGDDPGFPVTITKPGSYRLGSNLTVPDLDTTAIEIESNHVTIDLNGYAIIGPNPCVENSVVCLPGFGTGVRGYVKRNVTVRNGTITGMGRRGVAVGPDALVEKLHVQANGDDGIEASGTVRENVVARNNGVGIRFPFGGVAVGNTVSVNASYGISFDNVAFFGAAMNNLVYANGGDQIVGTSNQAGNLCSGGGC